MPTQYAAYIATSLEPYQIILRLSEELKLSGPIKPPREEGIADDRPWYYCEIPLGLEELPANAEDHIDVTIGLATAGEQEYADSIFDILGIIKQGQPTVSISIWQPRYNQFPVTNETQAGDFDEEGYLQILRVMGTIFRCVEGDGFMRRDDTPCCQFIRKTGEVIIDVVVGYWREQEKQAFGLPLTIGKIPEIF